jgi:hypothetical protein
MKQIAIQVEDDQKAALLTELLSSLDFVRMLEVSDPNGVSYATERVYPIPHISPEHAQMRKEEAAFEAMKPRLIAEHDRQFVAVFNQKMVDHDENELALLNRINQNYPNDIVLIRQVLEQSEPALMFRSPYLIQED